MQIREDDLEGPQIRTLLEQHFSGMLSHSPEGTCHFLDFDGLKSDDVTFWSIWDGEPLAGCGALKVQGSQHGEIKSMRVADPYLGTGTGHIMLQHIIMIARGRGYGRLSLETGTGPAFEAAHILYRRAGFEDCPPFGDYVETPFNRYMTIGLS